jgi:hypothetical protein
MDPSSLISLFRVLRGASNAIETHKKAEEAAQAKANGTYNPPSSSSRSEWGAKIIWVPVIASVMYLSFSVELGWSWRILLGIIGFVTYPLCFFTTSSKWESGNHLEWGYLFHLMAMMFVGAICMSFVPVRMLLLFKEKLGFWSYPLTFTLFLLVVGLPLKLRMLISSINNSSILRQLDREKSSSSEVEPVAKKFVVDARKNHGDDPCPAATAEQTRAT